MIRFKHSKIYEPIEAESGLFELAIENPSFLYEFISDIINEKTDSYSFLIDGKEKRLPPNSLLISDPYTIDPNSKKLLTAFYSKIQYSLTDEQAKKFAKLSNEIEDFMSEINLVSNVKTTYSSTVAFSSILDSVSLRFSTPEADFLHTIAHYLRCCQEASNIKIVFIVGLFDLLTPKEVALFSNEVDSLGLVVVSICSHQLIPHPNGISTIIIDHDLCEIS